RTVHDVGVWEIADPRVVSSLGKHRSAFYTALAWMPDGKRLVAANIHGGVTLLGRDGKSSVAMAGHGFQGCFGVAVSADGKTIATAGGDGLVILWDGDGKLRKKLEGHAGRVNAVAFAPGGLLVSSGDDRTVRFWEVGKQIEAKPALTVPSEVLALAVSADGPKLVGGCADGGVRVWTLEDRKEVARFDGHKRAVYAVAVTSDGRRA